MKLALGEFPFQTAMDIIQWCFLNNIDVEKCVELMDTFTSTNTARYLEVPDQWSLEVPDQYVSWVLLKFS